MKLSQIRPCDNCDGPIMPTFYVVRMSIALFKPQATNQVLAMTQYFRGSLVLGELFSGDDEAVVVAMDDKEHQELTTELFLCQACQMSEINLAALAEKRQAQIEAARKREEAP